MIDSFVVFAPASGRILRSGMCPEDTVGAQALPGEAVLVAEARDDIHYVLDGEIVDRPAMPITHPAPNVPADATTEFVVQGIPHGATVSIEENRGEVPDGELRLTFDAPGTYTLRLEKFPYLDTEIQISAD